MIFRRRAHSSSRWGACAAPNGHSYAFTSPTSSAAYYDGGDQQRDGARLHHLPATGKYWLLGGWTPLVDGNPEWDDKITTNQVWSSPDSGPDKLKVWTLEIAHRTGPGAHWERRHEFMSCNHTVGGIEYIYVLGSDDQEGPTYTAGEFNDDHSVIMSDVWRSSDGIMWERVAASSPWGPKFQAIVGVLRGEIHVMGGLAIGGFTSAEHWKSADGITWTQLADMPFSRMAVYDAPAQCGRLHIIGGWEGDGTDPSTQAKNDVWTFDGSMWHQQTAEAPFSPCVWNATAVYDGKIWKLTGNAGTNIVDTCWWSEDGGANWTQIDPPLWGVSHADAVCVTDADGIVLASGNLQEGNVYTLKAA